MLRKDFGAAGPIDKSKRIKMDFGVHIENFRNTEAKVPLAENSSSKSFK